MLPPALKKKDFEEKLFIRNKRASGSVINTTIVVAAPQGIGLF